MPLTNPTHPIAVGTRPRRIRRPLIVLVVLGLLTLSVAGGGTFAAFQATTTNGSNAVSSGSVSMSENDGGNPMFSVSGLQPNSTQTRCIKVTSGGTLPTGVRLYGTVAGTGLADYASIRITRGTYSSDPGFSSCTNFSPDSTNYSGLGNGVIHAGTLSAFPSTWAAGVVDPTANWTTNENHVYKFEIAVGDNRTAQSKNATAAFTWEGQG